MSEAIRSLIDQIERATEGSDALDELIAKATGTLPPEATFAYCDPEDGSRQYDWPNTDEQMVALFAEKGWAPPLEFSACPFFSRSLDEARSLIDQTMADLGCPLFTVQTDFRRDSREEWCSAEITVPSREFPGRAMGKDAQARAWVAAALRAKAFYPKVPA